MNSTVLEKWIAVDAPSIDVETKKILEDNLEDLDTILSDYDSEMGSVEGVSKEEQLVLCVAQYMIELLR